MRHIPVLQKEVLEALRLKPGMKVVDATLGDAGHAEQMLELLGKSGQLLGIDVDPESLLRAKQYLYRYGNQAIFVRDNFVNLKKIVEENNFLPVDAILIDLGWSSPQFKERGRGFSFEGDEPLDMRYSGGSDTGDRSKTAADIINNSDWDDIYRILRRFGEEDLSKEISDAIVEERKKNPITRTKQLTEIILSVYRKKLKTDKDVPWIGGLHPATKVFQALRIAVNEELSVIEKALPQAVEILNSGGRLAVITFHSGEDRIVKHYFKNLPEKDFNIITKKPLEATDEERAVNPSARSAKLRVIERI